MDRPRVKERLKAPRPRRATAWRSGRLVLARPVGQALPVSSLVEVRRQRQPPDPGQGQLDARRPLGVYVHFPFCSVRCPYCDFAVDTRPVIPHDAYADAVMHELRARAPWYDGAPLASLYFGGGTPGLWRPDALGRVIEAVLTTFVAGSAPLEITVEANPGELTPQHLAGLRAAGVNRLSIGVQSFDDELLRALGRNHDAQVIDPAFRAARDAGFENLSCDLMFGLPGQTLQGWQDAVGRLIELGPEHLSAYALTVERGTRYGSLDRKGQLARPGDEESAAMFVAGRQALAAAGYEPYEVSSYARPGRRAVHNALYWSGGAYLGLGAGAASFRPLVDGSGWRFTNPRATDTYLKSAAARAGNPVPALVERRSADDLAHEALWLALRTSDGVDRAAYVQRYGRDPLASPATRAAAQRCVDAGWLKVDEVRIRLTEEGVLFADEVAARLWA